MTNFNSPVFQKTATPAPKAASNKTVQIETKSRIIASDGQLKPTSPVFTLKNVGTALVVIDNNFGLLPGQGITIGVESIVADFLLRGIPVEQATTFAIKFDNSFGTINNLLLIETHFKLV